jgi:iron complex outermembrane receptor protein
MMRTRLVSMVVACALATASGAARANPEPSREDTLKRVVPFPAIEVSTTRSGDRAPLSRSVLGRAEIVNRNWGQDTPMALATLPGAYAYSDAGNGIGYSYLSIRGFPQRRISVLIDGVPLNDPESHEVYWIDHPDLLASTSEVEMQRGVGSALYGAASVGGSVNLETSPLGDAPRAAASIEYGSYETKRLMLELSSGPLAGGWSTYARYSRIESFGYREESWSRLWSYDFSVRRLLGAHSLRLNLFGGPEETHLAYLGIPREYLNGEITGDADRDRRFNPIDYKNERDHFFEPHYELIHSWAPRAGLSLTQTAFFFDGRGYYDERRANQSLADYRLAPWATDDSTLAPRSYYRDANADSVLDRDGSGRFTIERSDVVRRRWIENRHFGWVPRVKIEHARGALTIGGEIRWHDGHHRGEVLTGSNLPPGTATESAYYDFHPRTRSGGLFLREEWQARGDVTVTGDLAWRHQGYYWRNDVFDGVRFDQSYDFAIPRLGATWTPRAGLNLFASWAGSSREPALRDLYDGESAGNTPLFKRVDVAHGVFDDPLVRPEKVNDYELGGSWRRDAYSASLDLFRMDFRDELVFAGQFNTDLGYPILGNAAKSVHRGIEAAARARWNPGARTAAVLDGNLTLSDNHFVRYREVYGTTPDDVVSYDGKRISLFPSVLANLSARLEWSRVTAGAEIQSVGRIYLDNTETRSASISPRTVLNLLAGLRLPAGSSSRLRVTLRVNNALDLAYATSGYMDFDAAGTLAPQFVPAAKRNVLGEVRMDW